MTQDALIILLLRVVLIAGVISILLFVAQASRRNTLLGHWWESEIGRTIVAKDILLVLAFIPSILSLFFHFSRFSSHVAAWLDVVVLGLVTPVMLWRVWVWEKIHRHDGGE